MTVRKHATKSFRHLNLPVSYTVLDEKSFADSRNVFNNKDILETRYGMRRYNTTSLGGSVLSMSWFKTDAGVRYLIAKVGTVLYSVAASGVHTSIKTGLTSTTKHRAVTTNNRHIISIEADGLFSWNGTTFTALGQAAPATGSVASVGGGSLSAATYQVGLAYYASGIGFESNVYGSAQVTSAANDKINITSIPTTATNALVDYVRIYLKNITTGGSYLFVADQALGGSTYTISTNPTSTQTIVTKNAPPISGGGSYLTMFGKRLAYTGNSTFKSEVFISEPYLPDAFDGLTASQVILQIPGDGPVVALATGLFSDTFLTPFLAIFKRNSISIYSELNSIPNLSTLDTHCGCISNETIRIRNGGVFFMSDRGWHGIVNGLMLKNSSGDQMTLGNGAIDDIFTRVGWSNELNIPQASTFFSVFYSANSQYLTFICEGGNTSIYKAYVYEESIGGFKIFEFKTALTSGVEGEDSNGYQVLFLSDATGTIYTYSNRNDRTDTNASGTDQTIPAFALLPYIQPGEDANSYNFRTLVVRAYQSSNNITVKAFPSFSLGAYNSYSSSEFNTLTYDFTSTTSGFILDVSQLDIGTLGDERMPVSAIADLNMSGESLLLGFYQDILNANIGIISAQISINKNGNNNK